ncbi:MAG: signal peptide peptidase SppA [Gammaproteobacteria bacterium]|nr:MAG: signal peptide peptidase SppA [Gammaproteobacteria bacterium]TLZ08330.1 MAG: signal peptide peptidase SppA [Gammaproteobacteria bacterium]TLZ11432.1 MAG: signal peptide peptidase SppA [Gammaproteobacteria bacterium]TLZ25457.1 MAG: signal peptide peptidase SppA [Gammaproteobacteria bacterium]
MTVRSFFFGLWRGLDALRKVLHLVLLLVIFAIVVGALRGAVPRIPSKAALLVAPQGELVEQLSGAPVERALQEARGEGHAETLLWDLTDSIHAAASDTRIPVLALDLEKFEGATQVTLEELANALREFRASGKKVIAYGTEFTQERYYLAAQADEVYLDPMGFVLLTGYDRYPTYLKGALDKLGVDINVFRVGAFKSAVEPFTRTGMSAEDREESRSYLNALWSSYQEAVTRARKLPSDALAQYVGSFAKSVPAAGGDAAQVALRAKLVTGVKSRLETEQRLIELVGRDDTSGSFKSVSASDYVRYARAEKKARAAGKPRVGVIVAAGNILDGDQPPGTVGGESTARLIREARLDKDVKAVVLRVDSPGGSVLASEQIYRELLALHAAGKPLVVSMSGYAASGGYYIAAPADEIWASPATLTGSIGIFAIVPTVDKTLGKVGVSVDGVGTTPLSGQLRIDRPLGEEVRAFLQSQISRGYDEFVARVARGRNKTREQIDAIAQGRVWAGTDAHRVGLVDHIGSFSDAVKAAARRAKLTDYAADFIEPELTWAQQLVLQLRDTARVSFLAGPDERALSQLARRFDPVTREVAKLSRFSAPNRLYAYCFCEVR